ncbi:het-eN [Verticillium alfalfae VaMs.102]|uniref:Het-eN n=1 Tax=Verticillium alfalfae (strain VaMs.102 / ATCC MYA-4576 / FGSC 10136) TaxID=526221 RepID=C9SCK8_VERA1|nr:het-eN [Verticillium alfalfae VaMs.102]EEY16823.1 het-eN [Verticillium alfalfae VaMs.102]
MAIQRADTLKLAVHNVAQPKSLKEDLFPNDHFLGVRVLHTPPNPQVDIIFIHGITGHPYKTFATNGASPIYWPTQLLARDVPEARILSFGYDADVAKFLGPVGQNDIREHAATLISDIATVRIEDHARDSEALADIEAAFGIWLRKNTARFQLTCFFEEREVVGVGMVVNKDSAKISGYPQLPVPTNHMDLVRFASTEDTGYRRVLGCMSTLFFPEMNARGADVETAAAGTCRWILEHPTYLQWHANGQGLLWVKGKPGCGKSTLMKHVIKNSSDIHPDGATLKICFYFHGRGTDLQRSPLGLFRALVHQIGQAYPRAVSSIVNHYKKMDESLAGPWSWRPQDLEDFFVSDVLPALLRRSGLCIFIDALDECGEKEARRLVQFFTRIYDTSASSSYRVSICFSCRHYPIIAPDNCEQVVVESANDKDIARYIDQELTRVVTSPEDLEALRQKVEEQARQVFLWVVLVIPQVVWKYNEGSTVEEIVDYIDKIPPQLHNLYANLITELKEKSALKSKQLFQWICFGTENLPVDRLRDALNFDGEAGIQRGALFIKPSKDFLFEKGFAMLDGVEQLTLTEITGASHHRLAKSCLLYFASIEKGLRGELSSFDARRANHDKVRLYELTEKSYYDHPFLAYSVRYLFTHCASADEAGLSQGFINDFLGDDRDEVISNWAKVATSDNIETQFWEDVAGAPEFGTTLLHEAAKHNIKSLVPDLVGSTQKYTGARDFNNRTPLVYAVWNGRQGIVEYLISRPQTDVNAYIKSGSQSFTAFQLALLLGFQRIALDIYNHSDFDLDAHWTIKSGWVHETDMTTFNNRGLSSANFSRAIDLTIAHENMEEVFDRLLASYDRQKPYGQTISMLVRCETALKFQQGKMLLAFLKRLSMQEIDTLLKSDDTYFFLHDAVQQNFEEGVRHLIAARVCDLNKARGVSQSTPLHLAITHQLKSIAEMLVKAGADVDKRNATGQTSLTLALQGGYSNMVHTLLSFPEVDPNVGNDDWSPIEIAVEVGDSDALEALLQRPDIILKFDIPEGEPAPAVTANPDGTATFTSGGNRYRPLQRSLLWQAINRGHGNCARVLLADGRLAGHGRHFWLPVTTDRESVPGQYHMASMVDVDGNCLLSHLIICGWEEEAIDLLKQKDSPKNSSNYQGETALMLAVLYSRAEVIKFLLESPIGGSVDWLVVNRWGQNLLVYAESAKNDSVTRKVVARVQKEAKLRSQAGFGSFNEDRRRRPGRVDSFFDAELKTVMDKQLGKFRITVKKKRS